MSLTRLWLVNFERVTLFKAEEQGAHTNAHTSIFEKRVHEGAAWTRLSLDARLQVWTFSAGKSNNLPAQTLTPL